MISGSILGRDLVSEEAEPSKLIPGVHSTCIILLLLGLESDPRLLPPCIM